MPSTSLATIVDPRTTVASLPPGRKLLLLLGNAIPLVHGLSLALIAWNLRGSPWIGITAGVAAVYLAPPLACRMIRLLMPIRRTAIAPGSREFFAWWISLNLQILFCRMPFLEEILRLVPGCYSVWLRLWGSKVGRLTYWAPGLKVLDRQLLVIGDHVAFGADVRLNSHVVLPDSAGRITLYLAPIRIGDHVSVGGYSLLVAGSSIAENQCTRAFTILPPFMRLENGRRVKPADGPDDAPCLMEDPRE